MRPGSPDGRDSGLAGDPRLDEPSSSVDMPEGPVMRVRSVVVRYPLLVAATLSVLLPLESTTVAAANEDAVGSPIFGVTLPPGYREWPFVSIAHEAGDNNDIRVVLGNETAMTAFRNGVRPFPDGSIIVRLAYVYEPSAQNNAAFGREQSFVAGKPTNVQVEVKDSKRYASTGGWGYGQFEEGKVNTSLKVINSCFACHQKLPAKEDFIFTRFSR
ncbi:cytochrome P460 family protein [Cupriavidus plantarum]|uniref:cytochrome P460 family protein n=1 Tax=Cupriavidus plantarum TaxID=942865 RepID=UPI00339D6F5F